MAANEDVDLREGENVPNRHTGARRGFFTPQELQFIRSSSQNSVSRAPSKRAARQERQLEDLEEICTISSVHTTNSVVGYPNRCGGEHYALDRQLELPGRKN